jgi:glycosyltransferase involved in cell wall biosynthesis
MLFKKKNSHNKKPKIALIHPAVGDSLGGSQVIVLELAERLKESCDVDILSSKKANELCEPIACITRGEVLRNPKYNKIRKALGNFANKPEILIENITSFFPLVWKLLKNKYDVILPNNDWGGLLAASVVRRLRKTPIIFTEHSGLMEEGKIARRNLFFKPDKYVIYTNELKYWLKKYYPETDAPFIPMGVNFERFNPQIQAAALDLPRPIFLASSRHQKNKRLDLVIEAVSLLEKGSLLLLCPGENTAELIKKGEKLLGKKRFKLTSVPYEEIPSYYKACDIFTLPSLAEPFGLVYLEAMACNKPVVATKDFSRMDIVGEAGILCDVTNIEEYAHALQKAAEHHWENIPYEQARKFTWESCADKYYNEIQELVK